MLLGPREMEPLEGSSLVEWEVRYYLYHSSTYRALAHVMPLPRTRDDNITLRGLICTRARVWGVFSWLASLQTQLQPDVV